MAASHIVCNFEYIDHHIYKDYLSFIYLSAALVNFGFGSFVKKKQKQKHKIYHLNSLLNAPVSDFKYIHIVVHPSPLCISRTFSSSH